MSFRLQAPAASASAPSPTTAAVQLRRGQRHGYSTPITTPVGQRRHPMTAAEGLRNIATVYWFRSAAAPGARRLP